MRRYTFLTFALYAAVEAAPTQNPVTSASIVNGRSTILLGRSGYVVEPAQTELSQSHLSFDYGTENKAVTSHSTSTTDNTIPEILDIIPSSTQPTFNSEEDPELLLILTHVEDILSSSANPSEQISRILDAIVHHTESLRSTYEDLWPTDDILNVVDSVLGESSIDDEGKVEVIFNESVLRTKLKGVVEGPVREPVLLRLKAVLYGTESCQQKIKGILEEIAQYLGWNRGGLDWSDEQVSFGLGDQQAAEVGQDPDWAYLDNVMIVYDDEESSSR